MKTAHKKHLLFLSYYFPPMGGGGVQRILKFLKYWDYKRFEISVVTVKYSLFYAEDKKLLNDKDLAMASIQGQAKKLPVLFLTKGQLTKKASEMLLKEFKSIKIRKI